MGVAAPPPKPSSVYPGRTKEAISQWCQKNSYRIIGYRFPEYRERFLSDEWGMLNAIYCGNSEYTYQNGVRLILERLGGEEELF